MSWLGTAGELHPFAAVLVLLSLWITSGYFATAFYVAFMPNEYRDINASPETLLTMWPICMMHAALIVAWTCYSLIAKNSVEFGISIKR